jgi:uncharacterized protein YjbI with pentapeptide repeats
MALPFVPITEEYQQGERDFRKFYLERAELFRARLPEIILEEADLRAANLRQADLTRSKLGRADLAGADLSGARLVGSDLSSANLVGANFSGADLSEAILDRALLRLADFSQANLSRASLVGVDGRGWIERIEGRGTSVQRTSFQEALLCEANLTDAYLRLCDFRAADLTNATLVATDLTSVDAAPLATSPDKSKVTRLQGADLRLACLHKARFSFCDFRNANLQGADLRQAFIGGKFNNADLAQVLFFETVIEKCDFSGADLTGANLESCKFDKVRMPDGQSPGRNFDKYVGPPPNPSGKDVLLRPPEYTEYWFETYEELRALSWPSFCVCCAREFERHLRFSRENVESGVLKVYEVRAPYCTACLQHSIRTRSPREWMKPSCAAPGGNLPAFKFEVKARGMLSSKEYFVLSFVNPEYIIGFSSGNALPVKGFKGSW